MARHDPLFYLPKTKVQEFAKETVIYDANHPADHLYLAISGRIRVFYTSYEGTPTLLRIVAAEQFFGEACLMGAQGIQENAAALEKSQVMAWTRAEIEEQVEHEPKLGIALVEYCTRNNLLLQERVVGMAMLRISGRLALSLIQLAECLGKPTPDGRLRIRGLTHQEIADYTGTSREIISSEMSRLRSQGYLVYKRGQLDVSVESLHELLRQERFKAIPTSSGSD